MKIALALLIAFAPTAASADCIASSMNVFGVVQSVDAFTTNGPIVFSYPGGFLTQDAAAHCDQPGYPSCAFVEGDRTATRTGCVKSFATDETCVVVSNGAIREGEYLALRKAPDATRKDVCFLNYLASVFYAAVVIPNNLNSIYAIKAHGAYAKGTPFSTIPAFHLTLRRWSF